MNKFYLYILKCRDNTYYIGHTDDIEKRIAQHKAGTFSTCYTKNRLPVEVVCIKEFGSRYEALCAERKIKKWSRKKKEAYINDDWELISELSKRRKKIK